MTRQIYEVPAEVMEALQASGLLDAHHRRPPYQQNDYIGWITRAKRPQTLNKRIAPMLAELEEGGIYMSMKWAD